MATIASSTGTTKKITHSGECEVYTWVSPSTMDSADKVTFPKITSKTLQLLSVRDNTTGDAVTGTGTTELITVDAAGGTTNHVYVITYAYI
jgi:hypothetical protein